MKIFLLFRPSKAHIYINLGQARDCETEPRTSFARVNIDLIEADKKDKDKSRERVRGREYRFVVELTSVQVTRTDGSSRFYNLFRFFQVFRTLGEEGEAVLVSGYTIRFSPLVRRLPLADRMKFKLDFS